MILDPTVCYRALRTRDARFDGRFVVAVRSTGIYCRPVCPAPRPLRKNCIFLPCAAAAQEAGFRPCLRCRPEASPGTPAWLGTSATVSRALRLIGEGALDEGSVAALSARLGLGERQLRRLFLKHLGASPLAVAQTRRLHFAKKLIDETRLPMAQVALASGFSSVRRFNDVLLCTYGRTPRELRQRRSLQPARDAASEIQIRLPYRPPLAWQPLLEFLALRAIPGVEAVTEGTYLRSIVVGGVSGSVRVTPVPGANELLACIQLSHAAGLIQVAERLRRIFDLGADPDVIARQLGVDPLLRPSLKACPGLRVPGAWDGFELAVRAILGQQVSVRGATTLSGRLVASYGEPLSPDCGGGSELRYLFPPPEVLAKAELASVGLPKARAQAIRELARAVASGGLTLDADHGLEDTVARLCALPGIGAWTAQYIAMRALREPDAFPATDLGLRRALAGKHGRPPAGELAQRAEAWRPWRAYAAMHLWSAPH